MVWNVFGYWMFNVYADSRPIIDDEQKSDPAAYAELVRLMEGPMRQIEKKEGRPDTMTLR